MQELLRLAGGISTHRSEGESIHAVSLQELSRDPSLPMTSQNELTSLARETEPELLAEGLYRWARREERADRFGSAMRAYELLNAGAAGLEVSAGLRARVSDRVAVLSGGGNFGDRVEHLSQRFVLEASNPTAIAGMAVGSFVFSATRAALLARFAAVGRPILGASFLASTGAFAAEVPAFWASTKGLNEFLAPGSQDWSLRQNFHELAGLAITLGALKISGALVGRASTWAHRPDALGHATRLSNLTGISRSLAPQVGMLSGIMLGHRLEVELGLRPPGDGATNLTDSLALLLQFNIGGRLSQSLMGPRFQGWTQELELRNQDLASQARSGRAASPSFGESLWGRPLAMAMIEGPGRVGATNGIATPDRGRETATASVGNSEISGSAGSRLIPRSGRSADDRFETPMPAPEILRALQGRSVLREIENHLEGEGREGVSEAELGSAVGEALNRRIADISNHEAYEPLRSLTADPWSLDYSILPHWESLPTPFRESMDAAAELMQITQFARRSNQGDLVNGALSRLSPQQQNVYRDLVSLIPILKGPRFSLPRGDVARGSEVIQPEEAVLSHGTGDMSSLLKPIMRQARPGGRPWYARYFATDADARIVAGIRGQGRNPNFTKPVRHNYEQDIPIEAVHNRDPLATALFRRVRVQLLNVPSTVLDRFLSEDFVRNLPEGAVLVSAIGGLLNGGVERPRLPYQFIRERLSRYGRDDVEIVSVAGYIPGDKLWRGEHVEVNLSTREDPTRAGSPRHAADMVARLLTGSAGRTYESDQVTATISHWDHSNNLGKVLKNVFTLMVGYRAALTAREVVTQQAGLPSSDRRYAEALELGHSRYIRGREEVWEMMQGILTNNEGIKPSRARYNQAVYQDFDSCSRIEFETLVNVIRRAGEFRVTEAAPGDVTDFLQRNIFSPQHNVASTRNPRRGIAQAVYEMFAEAGLPYEYGEVGPKVTTEGVDSLGPLFRYYADGGVDIEQRNLPRAVYDLHQAFLGKTVKEQPRIGESLRMAIDRKPEDVTVIETQRALANLGLTPPRLRSVMEGSSPVALRILSREIKRYAELFNAETPGSNPLQMNPAVERQGDLLRTLVQSMQLGEPFRVIRSPLLLGPYHNAFVIQRRDPIDAGVTHQVFLGLNLEEVSPRMTSLGLLLRSFPPGDNVDLEVRIPNATTRQSNFRELFELQQVAKEMTAAFRRHRDGDLQLSLDRRPTDESRSAPEPPTPAFYESLRPLAEWVQGSSTGEEIRALFRRSRHQTSETIDEILRSGHGWPMLMGPAPGPIQSGIRAMATRPEKSTLMGVYAGDNLVDTFAVYRYSADEARVLSHQLMRRFSEAWPEQPDYRSLSAQDYFRGMTVENFLRDYRRYAELQNYGPLQVRTLPISYAPVEHGMVGNIPGINPGLLKLFLTEESPASRELLRRSEPLYTVSAEESRSRFANLAQPYLERYLADNGPELRNHPLFDVFSVGGLLRRSRSR